ncbi:cation-translocating P-type ATPase [Leptolyngbya iicbica]|uniref:Cation-transporting P-type ATPase n=2 Tax=Cyanophyceae TaxID=3028117 RepID=A0A4Q7EAG0_9CYAN|nr:cation-transporting P-type ATPase [Leptolyngbya sp. LK]RZM79513.1 cation-transporting P-type ATPase [Leptolyngbya sp. LK]
MHAPSPTHHAAIWSLPQADVYAALDSSASGLSQAEAQHRFLQEGPNELPAPPNRPLVLRLVDQFTHFMALLLWVAGILAFISHTAALGWAIWSVILINGLFSFWQEYQAERALAALKEMLPVQVRVQRDGEVVTLPARELVRGDVILLEEGDRISADARLVAGEELMMDVSVLTGESLPVARNPYPVRPRRMAAIRDGERVIAHGEAPLQERMTPMAIANLLLAGSSVAAGRGVAVVYATGAQTEFGHVAHLTTAVKREPSTLELQVAKIVRLITAIAVTMGLTVFGLSYWLIGLELQESFIFGIGIIVANVPEGLLPTVTLSLALGVQRMAQRNALVRRLSSVEALSATTVVCTDKTGTLTKNEMTVKALWLPGLPQAVATSEELAVVEVTGVGYDPTTGAVCPPETVPHQQAVRLLLAGLALCSNARLVHLEGPSRWEEIGDPTEAALVVAAIKGGLHMEQLQAQNPRQREVPFDSRRRLMTVVLAWSLPGLTVDAPPYLSFTKGAPLEVLRHCHSLLRDGAVQPLTDRDRQSIITANDTLARQGYRVLGLAARAGHADLLTLKSQDLEQHLTFVGLVAMYDPPRPEVPAAIAACHDAGIAVTMVTGDYGLTAGAIAHQIGLVADKARVVTGDGMAHLSDAQLRQILKYRHNLVFARMAPEHKLRLVNAYKDLGHIVAVTGDGVNDAPALRAANIGIAMGLNGTEVAREAADIVLLDDNFATIVAAVEQGRSVYQNIRKFMTYILASNIPEIVPFLAMVVFKIPPALTVMQILAIDLGTDMLPALALGAESPEPGIMHQPPRDRHQPLLNRGLLARAYGFLGVIEAIAAMVAFFAVWQAVGLNFQTLQAITPSILNEQAPAEVMGWFRQATTATLVAIVACQVGNLFACRSEWRSACRVRPRLNRWILVGLLTEWALVAALLYVPPLQAIFNTVPLAGWQWGLVFTWPLVLLGAEELRKFWWRRRSPRSP